MKKTYNGHESWNAWNVALWIGNDEGLYRAGLAALAKAKERARSSEGVYRLAARYFFRDAVEQDSRTPDGARYSARSVSLALKGLDS